MWYLRRGSRGEGRATAGWVGPSYRRAVELRGRRRVLGVALVGLVSLMSFLGLAFVDARREPWGFVLFWLVVLLLVMWLGILGIWDMVVTVRLRRRLEDAAYAEMQRLIEAQTRFGSDPEEVE